MVQHLKSDNVALNAYYAFQELPQTPEVELRMRQLLNSTDYQQRQYAAYYLAKYGKVASWPTELFPVMVDGLKDDALDGWNSFGNADVFTGALVFNAEHLPSAAVEALEKALDSTDLQQRQLAASVLTQVYQKQDRAYSTWPRQFLPTIVEGLRADNLHYPWTFQNHRMFLNYLYFLVDGRPSSLLQRELEGEDPQSRYGAAVILAHYLQGSVQPKVASELVANLTDDTTFANEIGAFQALVELGKPTAQTILANPPLEDWQQVAYLQCLAAYFDIAWSAPRQVAEQWYARATTNTGWGRRLEIAALYLYPESDVLLQGREMPSLFERLSKQGRSLRSRHDRAVWLGTWFWYLKPRPELWPIFSTSPYLDYSEFRLDFGGDYFNALEGIANIGERK